MARLSVLPEKSTAPPLFQKCAHWPMLLVFVSSKEGIALCESCEAKSKEASD